MIHSRRRLALGVLCALAILPAGRVSAQAAVAQGNPLKHAPQPTTAAITPADLMTRLYIFADDSMQGRQLGREGNYKGTSYIAREAERLGLKPAGDGGGWFQELPAVLRKFTDRSELSVAGKPLRWLVDWVASPGRSAPQLFETAQVIYGGVTGDTTRQISAEQATGKLVVLLPARPRPGRAPRTVAAAALAACSGSRAPPPLPPSISRR